MNRTLLLIVPFLAIGCASHPAASQGEARTTYQSGQQAELRHDYAAAEASFTRARDLTMNSDSDRAAWAQWQLAECLAVQPARHADALNALHRLIRDYGAHYLSARAQTEIDRLTGKKPVVVAQAPIDRSCGPETLAYLLQHTFGRTVPLESLQKSAGMAAHGTTLLGLQQSAVANGLSAEGVKVDLAYLRHLDKPAIAWVRRSHFLGVLATPATLSPPFFAVKVWDPTTKKETVMTPAEFSRQWDGYLLLLSRPTRLASR